MYIVSYLIFKNLFPVFQLFSHDWEVSKNCTHTLPPGWEGDAYCVYMVSAGPLSLYAHWMITLTHDKDS